MNTISWANSLFSLLAIIAIFAGFAIAGAFLPTVISWVKNNTIRAAISRPFGRLILWVSLGTLFSFPLIDLVGLLSDIFQVFAQPPTPFATTLGTVPVQALSVFKIILALFMYGFVFWIFRRYITTDKQLSDVERLFIVASIASLAYRGVNDIFAYVFSLNLPINVQQNYGFPGFAFQIIIGLLLLLALIEGLNYLLPNHPVQNQK